MLEPARFPPVAAARKCSGKCGRMLPPSEFYLKRGTLELVCKGCKRAERRARYARSRDRGAADFQPQREAGEKAAYSPAVENRPNLPHIEPRKKNKFWDTKYGRELTEEENRDIYFNLLALLEALKSAAEDTHGSKKLRKNK